MMNTVTYAMLYCLSWHVENVGAMMVGRPRLAFTPLSDASKAMTAAKSPHHGNGSYSLTASVLFAKEKSLRGGDNDSVGSADQSEIDSLVDIEEELDQDEKHLLQNSKYIKGLLENLEGVLDKWIVSGSLATRRRAYNILHQIQRLAMDEDQAKHAIRLVKRSGMPLDPPPDLPPTEHIPANQQPSGVDRTSVAKPMGAMASNESSSCGSTLQTGKSFTPTTYDGENRLNIADERIQWEKDQVKGNTGARSALSSRMSSGDGISNALLSGAVEGQNGLDPFAFAQDKQQLQESMKSSISAQTQSNFQKSINSEQQPTNDSSLSEPTVPINLDFASAKASELVARAGSGTAFHGSTLGVGGLDDVLSQIQRRVWIPLAAPPSLLSELGIQPVRGLLLYGSPGCGKTLLARKLGSILSPARPITIVSGPEIMDKFVGSSEKNLREIFDNPPELYFDYKKNYGEPLAKTALHVIVLDEFDAIARARGGSGGKGDQGDAGVARDSVVNQLLAKMDGVDPLSVPTLLIGLTNKPSLIDPALMRPGRFEVKIEVPKPKTVKQRASILKVHMDSMMRSGRVLVRDAPLGSVAFRLSETMDRSDVLSYEELVDLMAVECDGMSGASLAGVARAAASRALERAVTVFEGHVADASNNDGNANSINDCLVTQEDFEKAVDDVFESSKAEDYEEKDVKKQSSRKQDESKRTKKLAGKQTDSTVDADLNDDSTDIVDSAIESPSKKRYVKVAAKSVNTIDNLTELNGDYADVSEHESVTEWFRAGVDIPDWGERFDKKSKRSNGSLRELLPKRKTMWKKLDIYGRSIEDTDVQQ